MDDLRRKRPRSHFRLQIGQRAENRQIEPPAERRAVDDVMERVQATYRLNVRGRVPEIGAIQMLHLRTARILIDNQRWLRRSLNSEEEIRAMARPGCSFLQILRVETGPYRIRQRRTLRFGEINQL